ncbi:MAG TPA: type IV pilin N-terminal domain-containing protein [Methanocorpusculum sp.]|nr:type IV pilin N-terminal domain-containing protein [Methanocorpusculum sp.]HJK80276.1 type IV pilin N-terminal domain-containing protein [Methanocorpusculum sp.]
MQKQIPKRDSHVLSPDFRKSEEGVSPVVGVMLMLIVTIVIAAIVAGFSTGLAASASPAPSAGFDYTIHAGLAEYNPVTQQPPVTVQVTSCTGELSSNDLQIVTSYTVPDTYNGAALANAGKVITHTIDGQVEKYGMALIGEAVQPSWPTEMKWSAHDDPFIPRTHLYTTDIVPISGNGVTVGEGMNDYRFFGGKAPIASGTTWWFKDPDQFLGFDVSDRTSYGFGDGSVVHITVIHAPTGTILSDKEVQAVW